MITHWVYFLWNIWGKGHDFLHSKRHNHQKNTPDYARIIADGSKMTNDHAKFIHDHVKMTHDHTKIIADHTKMTDDHEKMTPDCAKMTDDHNKNIHDPSMVVAWKLFVPAAASFKSNYSPNFYEL